MPLTKKGSEIMSDMKKEYGEKKGEGVFYASRNAGKISGVEGLREARRVRENAIRRFARRLRRQNGG